MNILKASELFKMPKDTLRYYEKIGLIPPVPRTLSGIRDYDETSCKWIDFIKCMRGAGLSIEVLTRYVALFQQGDSTINERKALLEQQRDVLAIEIEAKQKVLDKLNNCLVPFSCGVCYHDLRKIDLCKIFYTEAPKQRQK